MCVCVCVCVCVCFWVLACSDTRIYCCSWAHMHHSAVVPALVPFPYTNTSIHTQTRTVAHTRIDTNARPYVPTESKQSIPDILTTFGSDVAAAEFFAEGMTGASLGACVCVCVEVHTCACVCVCVGRVS